MTQTERRLERQLQSAKLVLLGKLRLRNADFDLHLVSNREMEKIRRALMARSDFRGAEARKIATEKTVNVLAFPETGNFPHPEHRKKYLGEIYLNTIYSGQNALAPLLIHGLLHLIGYRHYFERDRIKMQRQERILWDHLSSPDSTSARLPSKRAS